jgi:hypothetical protein
MACSTCKNKGLKLKEKVEESTEFVSKGVIWFFVIWTSLGIYGLYSLIHKFL